MTQEVAQYVTRSGDRVDGIATDVETVDDTATVFCYGQLVRALLGPDILLVAAVFHPFAQPYYPYAAIAASWNVIAPMDYWHSRDIRSYSAGQVDRFVADSITTIRAATNSRKHSFRMTGHWGSKPVCGFLASERICQSALCRYWPPLHLQSTVSL